MEETVKYYTGYNKSGSRFLSNIQKAYESCVHTAAKETGFNVTVHPIARYGYEHILPDDVGVWTNMPRGTDHKLFWQAYQRCKEAIKAGELG